MNISIKVMYKNEKLQNMRMKANMSQSQLASKAEISVRVLQDYERGARDPQRREIINIIKNL